MYSDTIGGMIEGVLASGSQNTDSLDYNESTFYGDYYVCQISTVNCADRSGWARYTRNPDTSVFILQHPFALDTMPFEWDSAVIVVRDSSISGGSNAFNKSYTWQKSYDNVTFFAMFTDSASIAQHNNDTLVDYDLYPATSRYTTGYAFSQQKTAITKQAIARLSICTGPQIYGHRIHLLIRGLSQITCLQKIIGTHQIYGTMWTLNRIPHCIKTLNTRISRQTEFMYVFATKDNPIQNLPKFIYFGHCPLPAKIGMKTGDMT